MPTYLYRCSQGHEHECVHKPDVRIDECFTCGQPVERVPVKNIGGFIAKGQSTKGGRI